ERLDLAEALHVRQRTAERGDVAVGIGAEVAEAPPQPLADVRIQLGVGRELLALALRGRRDVADPPLAEDLLCVRSPHTSSVPHPLCGSTSTTAVSPARRIAGAAAASRRAARAATARGRSVLTTSCARWRPRSRSSAAGPSTSASGSPARTSSRAFWTCPGSGPATRTRTRWRKGG